MAEDKRKKNSEKNKEKRDRARNAKYADKHADKYQQFLTEKGIADSDEAKADFYVNDFEQGYKVKTVRDNSMYAMETVTLPEDEHEAKTAETVSEEVKAAALSDFSLDSSLNANRSGETLKTKKYLGSKTAVEQTIAIRPIQGYKLPQNAHQKITIRDRNAQNDYMTITHKINGHELTLADFLLNPSTNKCEMQLSQECIELLISKNPNFDREQLKKPIPLSSLTLSQTGIQTAQTTASSEIFSILFSTLYMNAKDNKGNTAQVLSTELLDDTLSPINIEMTADCVEDMLNGKNGLNLKKDEPLFSNILAQNMAYERTLYNELDLQNQTIPSSYPDGKITTYSVPVQPLESERANGREVSYLNLMNIDGTNYAYLHLQNEEDNARTKMVARRYEISDMFFEENNDGGNGGEAGNAGSVNLVLSLRVDGRDNQYVASKMSHAQVIEFLKGINSDETLVKGLPDEAKLLEAAKKVDQLSKVPNEHQREEENELVKDLANPKQRQGKNAYIVSYDNVANLVYQAKVTEKKEAETEKDAAEAEAEIGHSVASASMGYQTNAENQYDDFTVVSNTAKPEQEKDNGETVNEQNEQERQSEQQTHSDGAPVDRQSGEQEQTDDFDHAAHMVKEELLPEYHPEKPVFRDFFLVLSALSLVLACFIPGLQFLPVLFLGAGAFCGVEGWNAFTRNKNYRIQKRNDYIDSINPELNAKLIKEKQKDISYYQAQLEQVMTDETLSPRKRAKEQERLEALIEERQTDIARINARSEIYNTCGRFYSVREYNKEIDKTGDALDALAEKYKNDNEALDKIQNEYLAKCIEYRVIDEKDVADFRRLAGVIRDKGELSTEDQKRLIEIQTDVAKNAEKILKQGSSTLMGSIKDVPTIEKVVRENLGIDNASGEKDRKAGEYAEQMRGFLTKVSAKTEKGGSVALDTITHQRENLRGEYEERRASGNEYLVTLLTEKSILAKLANVTTEKKNDTANNIIRGVTSALEVSEDVHETVSEIFSDPDRMYGADSCYIHAIKEGTKTQHNGYSEKAKYERSEAIIDAATKGVTDYTLEENVVGNVTYVQKVSPSPAEKWTDLNQVTDKRKADISKIYNERDLTKK